eukprot:2860926-Amphidinium_carterae.1
MALARSPVALKMCKSYRSTSLLGGQPDNLQLVALSSCEAELISTVSTVSSVQSIYQALGEMTSLKLKLLVTTDNSAALQMCTQGPRASFRTRHISIRGLHVHDLVQRGFMLLLFVPTQLQPADGLTKGLLQEFPIISETPVVIRAEISRSSCIGCQCWLESGFHPLQLAAAAAHPWQGLSLWILRVRGGQLMVVTPGCVVEQLFSLHASGGSVIRSILAPRAHVRSHLRLSKSSAFCQHFAILQPSLRASWLLATEPPCEWPGPSGVLGSSVTQLAPVFESLEPELQVVIDQSWNLHGYTDKEHIYLTIGQQNPRVEEVFQGGTLLESLSILRARFIMGHDDAPGGEESPCLQS